MKIKKIIVDEKPKRCGDCSFCVQFYDYLYDEFYKRCIFELEIISDPDEKPHCCYFEEQSE